MDASDHVWVNVVGLRLAGDQDQAEAIEGPMQGPRVVMARCSVHPRSCFHGAPVDSQGLACSLEGYRDATGCTVGVSDAR